MNSTMWVLVVVFGVCLILQGIVLRIAHRRKAALQQAKHLQFQQTTSAQAEQTKRQIGQLQSDLANARRQRKESNQPSATAAKWSSTMQELESELDHAPDSQQLPADGFADTQPWPQSQHART